MQSYRSCDYYDVQCNLEIVQDHDIRFAVLQWGSDILSFFLKAWLPLLQMFKQQIEKNPFKS